MTFNKTCPNCSYEIDLDSISDDIELWSDQAQCPDCHGTVEVPAEFWES